MYEYQPPGRPQTGTLNARHRHRRARARSHWLQERRSRLNTFALIFIGIWMWTGFAMVILSAGAQGHQHRAARGGPGRRRERVAGLPRDHLPAAACRRSSVVSTTIIITALKSFDIVYTMTNGNFDTDVIAEPDVSSEMFTLRRLRPGQRGRGRPAAGDHPDHGRQHQPVPGAGGDPMTAVAEPIGATSAAVERRRRSRTRSAGSSLHVDRHRPDDHLAACPTIGLLVNSFRPGVRGRAVRLVDRARRRRRTSRSTTTRDVLEPERHRRRVRQQPVHHDPGDDHPDLRRGVRRVRVRWMDFPGRNVLFVAVVGLLVVPLQTTLIPILRLFAELGHRRRVPRRLAGPHGLRPAVRGLPAAQLHGLPAAGGVRVGLDRRREPGHGVLPAGAADERAGDRVAGDLPVPVRLERPARRR